MQRALGKIREGKKPPECQIKWVWTAHWKTAKINLKDDLIVQQVDG